MSASLIVLLPVMLFGVVSLFCFVGCSLPVSGIPGTPVTNYTDMTILPTSTLIAYWPLSDQDTGQATELAAELVSGLASNYIDQKSSPSLYPWPLYQNIPDPPGPDIQSADAGMGMIAFAQPGIVAGDLVPPAGHPVPPACMVVNGCYVEVPFDVKLVPQPSFTVEAWVRADWMTGDTQAWRFVVDARDFNPCTGFGLFAKSDDNQPGVYRWAGVIGNGGSGSTGFTVLPSDELTIALGSPGAPVKPTHLALTFEGQTLTLFVDGDPHGTVTPAVYSPNITKPLRIGAGVAFGLQRPQPAGVLAGALFPFVGAIQDVALYSSALSPTDIRRHFNNGNGTDN
jgi:Concanavalin A-like lectin/glucanases superfamily